MSVELPDEVLEFCLDLKDNENAAVFIDEDNEDKEHNYDLETERSIFDEPVCTGAEEEEYIDEIINLSTTCDCSRLCYSKFDEDIIMDCRYDTTDMNRICEQCHINPLQVFMMGSLNSIWCNLPMTHQKGHLPKERQYSFTNFQFRGIGVCQKFYCFINSFKITRINNIRDVIATVGVSPPLHGNYKNSSKYTSMPFEVRRDALDFINRFANQNALVLPGRVSAHRNADLKILPSSMPKNRIYNFYKAAAEEMKKQVISLSSWYKLWNSLCPNIVIQAPKTDLCHVCQKNMLSINAMAALPDEQKHKIMTESTAHLTLVMSERKYYNDRITIIKKLIQQLDLILGASPPKRFEIKMHYSFDFAQQIFLPHSSQQVGPLYFLAGYKVALFGIAVEPLGKFVLYIIPESCITSKGSNLIISLLHHFFSHFGVGETDAEAHADNCCGQNKNNYMMQYLTWRVMKGLHTSFKLNFLPVGHTKFAPDLYFGVVKKKLRTSEIHCLADLTDMVRSTSCIIPCLVGNEQGEVYVPTYNWQKFFLQYKPRTIPKIKMYHQFFCSDDNPKQIIASTCTSSTSVEIHQVFDQSHNLDDNESLEKINPVGLSHDRQVYLYKMIRPYTSELSKDILCPCPSESERISTAIGDTGTIEVRTRSPLKPMNKLPTIPNPATKRKCKYCREYGHINNVIKGKIMCPKRLIEENQENCYSSQ